MKGLQVQKELMKRQMEINENRKRYNEEINDFQRQVDQKYKELLNKSDFPKKENKIEDLDLVTVQKPKELSEKQEKDN